MNLLVLSTWFPYPPDNGSRLRAFHLLRVLSERGHRIRLVTGVQDDIAPTLANGLPPELTQLCKTVIPVPWVWHQGNERGPLGMIRALASPVPRSILETPNTQLTAAISKELAQHPDAVLVMEMAMDAYVPSLPSEIPVILDQAEVSGWERGTQVGRSLPARVRARLMARKARAYWRNRFRRYQAITAVSEEEAEAVRHIAGTGTNTPPVYVVPNGVDVGAYSLPNPDEVNPLRLIYNGSPSYGPNRDAVLWFGKHVLPQITAKVPGVHLWVTGRYKEGDSGIAEIADLPGVTLTGFLPDLRPILATSGVCVVPLLEGGGTRLKILEAWAAGVPVVSTPIGAAGLGPKRDECLLLAQTPNEFADAVVTLLHNANHRQELARRARRYAEQSFDWPAIGAKLEEVLGVGCWVLGVGCWVLGVRGIAWGKVVQSVQTQHLTPAQAVP